MSQGTTATTKRQNQNQNQHSTPSSNLAPPRPPLKLRVYRLARCEVSFPGETHPIIKRTCESEDGGKGGGARMEDTMN
eukprot:9485381-Pyramimonas_sp.AAC.3